MNRNQDPRVDAYIDRAAEFARPILRHLRETVHAAAPDIEEALKWGFPHFSHRGILCFMAAFKQHCAFGFWKGSLVLGSEAGADDKAMGQFGRLRAMSDLPSRETLIDHIREARRLNEAGVKVPKKAAATTEGTDAPPETLDRALAAHPLAAMRFQRLSPSQRREYGEWIAEAKREQTRARRVATAIEWISEGKPRNWKYIHRGSG